MQKDKLTLAFCLHEIAHNIEDGHGICVRIGPVLLDCVYNEDNERNEYCVHDKNGRKEYFADLAEAINHFMAVVMYL